MNRLIFIARRGSAKVCLTTCKLLNVSNKTISTRRKKKFSETLALSTRNAYLCSTEIVVGNMKPSLSRFHCHDLLESKSLSRDGAGYD